MTTTTSRNTGNAPSAHEATHQRSATESNPKTKGWDTAEPVDPNVTELVLCAQCEMAMARVQGPFDMRPAFDHAIAARRWAYRAGIASLSGARLPFGFEQSPTLIEGWHSGQAARIRFGGHLSLVVG